MSFAAETKRELTSLQTASCCQNAELAALVRLNGIFSTFNNNISLDIQTEHAAIGRRVYSLIKQTNTTTSVEIVIRKKVKLKKNNVYIVRVTSNVEKLLQSLNILTAEVINQKFTKLALHKECCQRAYIRGAFLAGGSINNPDNSSYHLEILVHNEILCQELNEFLNKFTLNSRILHRKKGYICYIKEAEKISMFLTVVEAYSALFHFEDVRIVRDLRNSANRITNCDQANINKIVSAAGRQVDNIKFIEKTVGIDSLPDKLQEVAYLRLQYPEIALRDICHLLKKEKISKSGVYHRLRKLDDIANDLRIKYP